MTNLERRRAPAADVLIAAALAVLPLLPGLLSGRALWYRDLGQNHVPFRALGLRMLGEGTLPLWNPYRGSGQPFLATPNSLLLRPTTPLFLPFDPGDLRVPVTLSVMLLLGIASAGTFLLLRDLGRSRPACLLGAWAFSLAGVVQSLDQVLNHLEAIAFFPMTLWLLQRAFDRGWLPWGVAAGLCGGLVVSGGEPVWILALPAAALGLPGPWAAGWRRVAAVSAAALLFSLLAAAPQTLPLLEVVAASDRGAGLDREESLKWSLPPQALLQTAIPALWGDPSRAGPTAYWGGGLFETSLPLILSFHLGAPVLVLAAFGALRPGWPRAAAAVGAAGLVLSLGRHTPIYPALLSAVPGLATLRYPMKWFLLVTWCAALLASAGLDALGESPVGGRARRLRLAAAWGAGGLAAAGGLLWAGAGGALAPAVRAFLHLPAGWSDPILAEGAIPAIGKGLALAGASASLLLALGARGTPGEAAARTRGGLVAALGAAVLLLGASGLHPSAPPEVVFERSPLLAAIPEALDGRGRFFGFPRPPRFAFRSPSPAEAEAAGLSVDSLAWGMRWDVRTLRNATASAKGLRGAYDRLGDARLDLHPGSAAAGLLGTEGYPIDRAMRLLSAASVRYVLAYGSLDAPGLEQVAALEGESNVPVRVYRNPGARPRARLVGRAVRIAGADAALEAIASGAVGADTVILEGEPGAAGGPEGGGVEGTASIEVDRPGEVKIHVEAPAPSWLVLTDTWAPGWRASLDGAPIAIERADAMFRAVRVPAGAHEVRMLYRPATVTAGAALGAAGWIGGALLILAGARSRRAGSEA